MFTSTNTINPFTLLSSSSSSPFYDPYPYIVIGHEANIQDDSFFHHQIPPTVPQIINTMQNLEASSNDMISNQIDVDVIVNGDQEQNHPPFSAFLPEKRPVKKDRHSKICTAQGLRDRRVRLSIEIARKFFDLQDMLGYDKASKTLEWLLSKSRKAIRRLAQGDNSLSSSSTTCDSGEVEGIVSRKDQSVAASGLCNDKRNRKTRKAAAAASNLVAKESRAKARERARERTRVKLSTRKFQESKNHHPHILNQQQHYNHHQACEKSSGCNATVKAVAHHHDPQIEEFPVNNFNLPSQLANLVPKGNNIEESIVIKRKLKPSIKVGYQQRQSTMMGYQQNFVMFKDASYNNNHNLPNLPQNWGINSAIAHTSFCGITNMNRPTGFHHNGKFWEAGNI